MWNISATALNNAAFSKASAPYRVAEPRHIVAGVTALIMWREALSARAVLVKSLFILAVSGLVRRYAQAHAKNDADIEEMIADGGFGFQAKVK